MKGRKQEATAGQSHVVRLRDVMPGAPRGITVTADDAGALLLDEALYGNTFLKKTGVKSPSHQRIAPVSVTFAKEGPR